VCDTNAISACLHRRGALAFFDYATAAPYVKVDVNPPPDPLQYPTPDLVAKDAIFFSPHKMLGGVGAPGVLVVKKHLVSQQNPPKRSGGGTVFYVTHASHRFLSNRLERYEGGTPNVPGIVRAGLACLVKRQAEELYVKARDQTQTQQLNYDSTAPPPTLEEYEYQTYENVAQYLQEHAPNLVLLGRHEHQNEASASKLPIFSFLIRWGKRFLHYNYVCAVLNDVFGIQSRGGCQCSGPYSQFLLGLTETNDRGEQVPNQNNRDIERALLEYKERAELLRPGYSRLSLPFKGLLAEEVEYVKKALVWVSRHAWELMCLYRCNHRTGEVRTNAARVNFSVLRRGPLSLS
jgi:selenocysteine lyase/cysteine desulfurase